MTTDLDTRRDRLYELLREDVIPPEKEKHRARWAGLALVGIVLVATVGVARLVGGEPTVKRMAFPAVLAPGDGTGTTVPDAPAVDPPGRVHAAMAAGPDSALLVGGQGLGGIQQGTWRFSSASVRWEEVDSVILPPARAAAALVYVDSLEAFLYFGGTSNPASAGCPPGCVAQRPTDSLWRFDVTDTSWSALSSSGPEPRLAHAAAYDPMADRLVVFGGVGSTGEPGIRSGRLIGDTWLFDPTEGSWTQVESPVAPEPRAYHQMVYEATTGLIYLWGGRTEGREGDPTMWAFDAGAGTWTALPLGPDAPPARWLHAMTTGPDGTVMVLGGEWFQSRQVGTGTTTELLPTAETWAFDPSDGSWERRPPLPEPMSRHSAAAFAGGSVIVHANAHTYLLERHAETWTDLTAGE